MISHPQVCEGHVAGKVCNQCCIGHMYNVKNVTFEPVFDSVPGLFNIFSVAPILF